MKNEILKGIILSTKSQSIISKLEKTDYLKIDNEKISRDVESFYFNIKKDDVEEYPVYRFSISVNRILNSYFFKNWSDKCSRYYTKIDVMVKNSSHSSFYGVDEITFDSEHDDSVELQKELFKILKDNIETFNNSEREEKVKKYLVEIKKTHGKDVLRDEKINEILL
jgi:hypothetical protein